LAILELRAARAWSQQQTADTFQVTAATISSWMRRLDEQGPAALVRLPEPVNKFPDFVRYLVQRLKTVCPLLGKVKIAQILARAGLHLGVTTVGRILKEPPAPAPAFTKPAQTAGRVVTAERPDHVWHVDLTTVPTQAGLWCPWPPAALPQCWPFCWWLALVVDHFSRRVLGFALFAQTPTSAAVRSFLGRTMAIRDAKPKYLICDKGVQFWCPSFKAYCRRQQLRVRYGAVGQPGSLAIIERTILTTKQLLSGLRWMPIRQASLRRELAALFAWYNEHRPHTALRGATPDEIYHGRRPANRLPRWEPRPRWPRAASCARPRTLVKGQPGVRLHLAIDFRGDRQHLPQARLQRAA